MRLNTLTVELIYLQGCPNIALARERLLQAFAALGIPPRWQEWERDDPTGPAHARAYGSFPPPPGGRRRRAAQADLPGLWARLLRAVERVGRGVRRLHAVSAAVDRGV